MSYKVLLRPGAERQRRKLEDETRRRINEALLALEKTPRPPGVVKLRNAENEWRIRVGDYRVIYEVDEDERLVVILRIRHRREAYR
jgi:mRNA interferase RelE/StbE